MISTQIPPAVYGPSDPRRRHVSPQSRLGQIAVRW